MVIDGLLEVTLARNRAKVLKAMGHAGYIHDRHHSSTVSMESDSRLAVLPWLQQSSGSILDEACRQSLGIDAA